MGSIFKSPKAPTLPSAPVPVAQPSSPTVTPTIIAERTDTEIQNEAREQSLLRRNRGRFGTINTGFSGFLGTVNRDDSRKTLLGE